MAVIVNGDNHDKQAAQALATVLAKQNKTTVVVATDQAGDYHVINLDKWHKDASEFKGFRATGYAE